MQLTGLYLFRGKGLVELLRMAPQARLFTEADPTDRRFERDAERLSRDYEAVSFEQVHEAVLDLLPIRPSQILDVGAGSGRDAAALARRGHAVTAVEPSVAMRRRAQETHQGLGIEWIDDRLPRLTQLRRGRRRFDVILVSAVWMYLRPEDREDATGTLAGLLAPSGLLIVSLRHVEAHQRRQVVDVTDEELIQMAGRAHLSLVRRVRTGDALERREYQWATLVFRSSFT
jgi:protein-L-isoaspartate O-methyltransferase